MTAQSSLVVVTACYNDWPSLQTLLPLLDAALVGRFRSAAVVVVDDGSSISPPADLLSGHHYQVISKVEILTLARNLGNQRAQALGIGWAATHAPADWLAVMDCDHEDRPEVIPELLKAAEENSGKIVFAARIGRTDGVIFRIFYALYSWLYRLLTGMPIAIGNFSIVPGALIRRLAHVWEIGLHYPAGVMKARLPYTTIGAVRGRRVQGRSSMNFVNLFVHGFSGLAVHAEVAAMRVVLATLVLSGVMLVYLGEVLFEKLFTDIPLLGWTSQIAVVLIVFLFQAFMSGLLLLFLVLSGRTQKQMIPYRDHGDLILEVLRLYPFADRKAAQ